MRLYEGFSLSGLAAMAADESNSPETRRNAQFEIDYRQAVEDELEAMASGE